MFLGEIIKKYRFEHSLSLQSFADKCGLSKGYIAMLERNVNSKTGESITPSLETFIKVSSAMGIDIDTLIRMVDENQPVYIGSNYSYEPTTIAAHHDEEDWTDEELAEIEEFKRFVKSKRKKQE